MRRSREHDAARLLDVYTAFRDVSPAFQNVRERPGVVARCRSLARLGVTDLDWSSDGVDWRDESRDPDMARDWLREADGADHPGSDLWNRVYELTHEALDPPRGWRLVKLLVENAQTDRQLWHIGGEPLAWIVDNHPQLVSAELAQLYRADPKWRQSFKGQISRALFDFEKRLTATEPPASESS